MKLKNIYSSIPDNLPQELFEQLAGNDQVVIERIISKGHKSPSSGWYDQHRNEWVLLLKGKAALVFDGHEAINLNEGDFINIPPHQKHKVDWTDPDNETIWLVIHY